MTKLLFLFAFMFFLFFPSADIYASDFVWENTEIRIPVYDDAEGYYHIPNVYYRGKKISYTIGVDGTSATIINTDCLGLYQIVYQASYDGKISKQKILFYVYDDIPPSLLFPVSEIRLPVEATSIDYLANIKYRDNYDYEEEIKIEYDASRVSLHEVGEYFVYYTLTDVSLNSFYFKRKIIIYDDMPPQLEFSDDLIIELNQTKNDYLKGVTQSDNYDNNCVIIYDIRDINFSIPGEYSVGYCVYDSSGNKAWYSRKCIVIDSKEPVIALKQYSMTVDIDFKLFDLFIRNNILSVNDNYDYLDINDCKYISNFKSQYGLYQVTYYAFDSSNNYGEAILRIEVKDNIPPEIIGGSKNILLNEVFDPYYYVWARDNLDGDISTKIIIEENTVDVLKEGLYYVTYSVYDSGGNYCVKRIYYNVTVVHNYIPSTTSNDTTIEIPYEPEERPIIDVSEEKNNNMYFFLGIPAILIGVIFIVVKKRIKDRNK